MKHNVFETKINYTLVKKEIDMLSAFTGHPPKYAVMSKDTSKEIIEKHSVGGTYASDTLAQLFGITVAYCEELSFGEIDIV